MNVRKLEDRSKAVVYLGKEPGTKASHLYDPISNCVHISRDVTYQEDTHWPWAENSGVVVDEVNFPDTYISLTTIVGQEEESAASSDTHNHAGTNTEQDGTVTPL